jgi:hypothetical protein
MEPCLENRMIVYKHGAPMELNGLSDSVAEKSLLKISEALY